MRTSDATFAVRRYLAKKQFLMAIETVKAYRQGDDVVYLGRKGLAAYKRALTDLSAIRDHHTIQEAVDRMIEQANELQIQVSVIHNGQMVIVSPGETREQILARWQDEMIAESIRHAASYKGAVAQQKWEAEEAERENRTKEINSASFRMRRLPGTGRMMTNIAKTNDDDFGRTIIRFAEIWAVKMEEVIATKGALDEKTVNDAANYADIFGLSGSMFGFAKAFLVSYWYYGKELSEIYPEVRISRTIRMLRMFRWLPLG